VFGVGGVQRLAADARRLQFVTDLDMRIDEVSSTERAKIVK
jgi:hypothetical protein